MKPVNQIISSLETEPEKWRQTEYTLDHENGTEIWTSNLPYLNIGIYRPRRKIGFIDKIRLQLAVNKWHRQPIQINENKTR